MLNDLLSFFKKDSTSKSKAFKFIQLHGKFLSMLTLGVFAYLKIAELQNGHLSCSPPHNGIQVDECNKHCQNGHLIRRLDHQGLPKGPYATDMWYYNHVLDYVLCTAIIQMVSLSLWEMAQGNFFAGFSSDLQKLEKLPKAAYEMKIDQVARRFLESKNRLWRLSLTYQVLETICLLQDALSIYLLFYCLDENMSNIIKVLWNPRNANTANPLLSDLFPSSAFCYFITFGFDEDSQEVSIATCNLNLSTPMTNGLLVMWLLYSVVFAIDCAYTLISVGAFIIAPKRWHIMSMELELLDFKEEVVLNCNCSQIFGLSLLSLTCPGTVFKSFAVEVVQQSKKKDPEEKLHFEF